MTIKSASCFAQRVAKDAATFASQTVSDNTQAALLASLPVDCSYPTVRNDANVAWNISFTNEIIAHNIVVSHLNAANALIAASASNLLIPLSFKYTALDTVIITTNNARDAAILIASKAVAFAQWTHDNVYADAKLTAAIATSSTAFTAKAARCSALQTVIGASAYALQTISNTAEIATVATMDCSSTVSNNAQIATTLLNQQKADASLLLSQQTQAAQNLVSDRTKNMLTLHDWIVTDPGIATSIATRDSAIDIANKATSFALWTIDTAITVAKKLSQVTEATAYLTAITARRSSIGC